MPDSTITDVAGLRELYAEPTGAVAKKLQTKLDEHYRRFIAASPFLVLGTSGDVSPRGNHPGFVQVLDENTAYCRTGAAITSLIPFKILLKT